MIGNDDSAVDQSLYQVTNNLRALLAEQCAGRLRMDKIMPPWCAHLLGGVAGYQETENQIYQIP